LRAIASATSTSDERNALSDILTKASAKRSASRSNATDFVALDVPGPRITVEEITDRNVERESD
jgi:Asp/Glu/hydantoin racemase